MERERSWPPALPREQIVIHTRKFRRELLGVFEEVSLEEEVASVPLPGNVSAGDPVGVRVLAEYMLALNRSRAV